MRATIFLCRIQPEGLFHDAERDLLAVANFLVYNCSGIGEGSNFTPRYLPFYLTCLKNSNGNT